MTVAATSRIAGPYICTGGETVLSYGFRILAETDLAVYRERGAGQEQLLPGVHYTVTGVGNAGGGSVMLLSAALADDQYVLEGRRPAARTSDLVYNRSMPPAAVNTELDSLQIQIKELWERVGRAVARSRFDASDESLDLPLEPGYLRLGDDGGLTTDAGTGGGGGGGGLVLPLAVENGGTGADTPGEARANLGLGALAIKDIAQRSDLATGVVALVVESRILNAPPGGAAAGATYIMGPGPLTGAWSARTVNRDVAISDGAGGWAFYVPSAGWQAEIKNEARLLHFTGSGQWAAAVNDGTVADSAIRYAVFEYQAPNGTGGGVATTGAWLDRAVNAVVYNDIPGLSYTPGAPGLWTFPVGRFEVTAFQKFSTTGTAGGGGKLSAQQRLLADNAVLAVPDIFGISAEEGATASGSGLTYSADTTVIARDTFMIDVQQGGTVRWMYWTNAGNLGAASAEPSNSPEVFARLVVRELKTQRGAPGLTVPDPLTMDQFVGTLDPAVDELIAYAASQLVRATGNSLGYKSPYGADPIIRSLREKVSDNVVDAADFGAKASNPDNAVAIGKAVAAVKALGGGIVQLPRGALACSSLPAIDGFAITLRGHGRGFATMLRCTTTTGDFLTMSGNFCSVEDVMIFPTVRKTSGFAIRMTAGECNAVRRTKIIYDYNGIAISASAGNIAQVTLEEISLGPLLGGYGFFYAGTAPYGVFGVTHTRITANNSPPLPPAVGSLTTWAQSTVFNAGQVIMQGGWTYMCTTGGTSAATGTGPSGLPAGTSPESAFSGEIVDGTARWMVWMSANLAWSVIDSYSFSIRYMADVALLHGVYGRIITDTVAAGGGASQPRYVHALNLEIDHPLLVGDWVASGKVVRGDNCWIGYCVAGEGIIIAPSFGGEYSNKNGHLVGHGKQGAWVGASGDILFEGTAITANSQNQSGLYPGLEFAAGVTGFRVVNCKGGPGVTPGFPTNQSYFATIGAGCDNYVMVGNDMRGNVTGALNDNSTGTDRYIMGNPGCGVEVNGDVVMSLAAGRQARRAPNGLGYATGSGGTVTQATSKATAVTLNKACGEIVTHNAALAAGAVVTFTLTNSVIAATDYVDVQLKSGAAAAGSYNVWVDSKGAGSCVIALRNITGGSLSEALTLTVIVHKAVAA